MKKPAQKIRATTQRFTEIEDIVDNVVILSFGNACLVIEVTATNFSLLSKEEQNAKILSYASLLNSLSFSIQIFIQSKKIDISSYLKLLDEEAKKTQNQTLANQMKLYRDFVETLVRINTVLDKRFYIVVPYSHLEAGVLDAAGIVKKESLQKEVFIQRAKTALASKAESLHSQLSKLGLTAKTLKKEELIKLFYGIYNADHVSPTPIPENLTAAIIRGNAV